MAQGIQSVFYNNYKWNIIFKKCESLCHIPETYITAPAKKVHTVETVHTK